MRFIQIISHYEDILVNELTLGEEIITPKEPIRLRSDTKHFLARQAQPSSFHWHDAIKKELSK